MKRLMLAALAAVMWSGVAWGWGVCPKREKLDASHSYSVPKMGPHAMLRVVAADPLKTEQTRVQLWVGCSRGDGSSAVRWLCWNSGVKTDVDTDTASLGDLDRGLKMDGSGRCRAVVYADGPVGVRASTSPGMWLPVQRLD